jgi:prolyl oligopeptidase
VGQPQSDDVFLYAIPEHPTWHIGAEVTDDGRCARSRDRGDREKQRAEKGTAKCPHPDFSAPTLSCTRFSYLLITASAGCEPTNRLFLVDIDALPRGEDGVLSLKGFDRRSPDATPLPVVKLVDNFDASYDYVANEGSIMTFHTNLNAPRYR